MKTKKSINLIAIVLLLVLSLTSCESLSSPAAISADAIVTDNGLTFYAYSHSSQTQNAQILKASKLFIVMNNFDFRWQRAIENSLKAAMQQQGFEIVVLSDIIPKSVEDITATDMWSAVFEEGADYVMFITIEDLYTYEHGGGVADVEWDIEVKDVWTDELLLHMAVNTDCARNEYASYAQSIGPASDCLAKAITKEYSLFASW